MNKGEMLHKMLITMINAHAGQFDKGGQPYALHPLKVMHYLKSDDEELNCIALGHDLFEDTKVTKDDMRRKRISERVIDGIWCMTKLPGETADDYKRRVMSNKDSIRVKMADLRHNSDIRWLKGVTDKDVARTVKYMHFYEELKQALKDMEPVF